MAHCDEMLEPILEVAHTYAYTTLCLHMGFVLAGQADGFSDALNRHMDNNLFLSKGNVGYICYKD